MILGYTCSLGHYNFVDSSYLGSKCKNTFTVIVGKNGTGKSRLLRSMVQHLLRRSRKDGNFFPGERDKPEADADIRTLIEFEKVICVSTSPFDRFPLPRRSSVIEDYSYLGLRGLPSANLSFAYLSKTVATLVESAATHREQTDAIAGVLDYLGYEPSMTISLQTLPSTVLEELARNKDPIDYVRERMQGAHSIFSSDSTNALKRMLDVHPAYIQETAAKLVRISRSTRYRIADVLIERGDLRVRSTTALGEGSDILQYLHTGFLRLKEVTLRKRGSTESLRINDASSGEQSVVLSLLGIASQIRDRSLICIDEPEICLHPEWQEKYIHLLHSSFRHIRDCHFLIATHSPQIVAQLPGDNCYVMPMETGVATNARRYSHKSIDYQLAEVFKAPGFRNEYLSRIALSLFSSVSKRRAFDDKSRATLSELEKVADLLQSGDPVLDIISALKEMRQQYE
ncbi:ATPase_AAA_core domain-containing protein [Paraburkholderia sabiae]|nr:ATPase_AAA_core domain-containing protein [Paraburkholderia sabiae]